MADTKALEEKLEVLRANVVDLRGEIEGTEKDSALKSADRAQRATVFSERVTQDLLAVDGVEISKSAASEALLRKDRKTAQKMAVLLARRKRLIQDLHGLAERVDKLSSVATENEAKGEAEGENEAKGTEAGDGKEDDGDGKTNEREAQEAEE